MVTQTVSKDVLAAFYTESGSRRTVAFKRPDDYFSIAEEYWHETGSGKHASEGWKRKPADRVFGTEDSATRAAEKLCETLED